ncbi:DUF134 domain-containing protein [Candidatus Hecatella orcuttiae]|jgi:hypothetical protein|uniref:DUF134 domain-containing protein n=1 Tax=Candidatus Hecatella orcuttiae TaxID=1935119 RepID=UPI002868277E|nr:DUF134 domain-containing protein [Candidatus Hecatella orcuttiae]
MAGYRWRWRRRFEPGRPIKPRTLEKEPEITRFVPFIPKEKAENYVKEPVTMTYDEFEYLRLVDYMGLMQEEAARRMGVSRGTIWRCLDSVRKKVASMIEEGRELVISS